MTIARVTMPLMLLLAGCAMRSGTGRPPSDEIWIVARTGQSAGGRVPQAPRLVAGTTVDAPPLVLDRTAVTGAVVGPFAALRVRQTYAGPDAATDGAFVLPLPVGAVPYDFVLTMGTRRIRAIVRPREEAEALHAAAARSGRTSSLLREENGVVVGIARLRASTPVDVELSYAQSAAWRAGAWELVVPRIPTGAVDLTLDVDAPAVVTVDSPTHAIARRPHGDGRVQVGLRDPATLRDADLRLRWAPASSDGTAVFARGARGAVAAIVLPPPAPDVAAVDWGTLDVDGTSQPARAEAGTPFVSSAWVAGGTPGSVRVTTVGAGRRLVRTLPIREVGGDAADALAVLQAAADVQALAGDRGTLRAVALRHGLLSSETALVAIDATPNR